MGKTDRLKEVIEQVYITMPFKKIDAGKLDLISTHKFNLEIGIDHYALDKFGTDDFKKIAGYLNAFGISMTVHAPFHELFLGASDRLVREAALNRMNSAFMVIPYFHPKTVVMHLNYETRRFGFIYKEWISHVSSNIVYYAQKCREIGAILMLENVYEESPEVMATVFESLKEHNVYHCFDVGHLNAFSQSNMADWLTATGKYIRQFHLHDNNGKGDQHAPIGSGKIRFDLVRDFISGMHDRPFITLEPHKEPDIWDTLEGFARCGLSDVMKKF